MLNVLVVVLDSHLNLSSKRNGSSLGSDEQILPETLVFSTTEVYGIESTLTERIHHADHTLLPLRSDRWGVSLHRLEVPGDGDEEGIMSGEVAVEQFPARRRCFREAESPNFEGVLRREALESSRMAIRIPQVERDLESV